MNYVNTKILPLISLMIITTALHAGTVTNIIPRSQSLDAARDMVGWNNPDWGINRKRDDVFYASMNVTAAYTQTFRDDLLTLALFGNDLTCGNCGPALIISGSQRSDRGATDWLADYFGLPRDYKSTVSFNPHINNIILDFSFYAGLDQWLEGLYFRIYGPFVHTCWDLGATEYIVNYGSVGYFQGYFGPDNINETSEESSVTVNMLNSSFLDYTNGCSPSLPDDVCWQSLACSQIANICDQKNLSLNGFADLRFILGWNFLNDEEGNSHLGLGIYVAAPTGNRPGVGCSGGSYLFQPIIGNGHFWELGGQVTAHHYWWHSDTSEARFGFFLEADITHMFNSQQIRCFDLCSNGPSSRYMLAQRLESNIYADPRLDGASDAGFAFANEFAPVANITQRQVNVSVAVQADIALSFQYQKNNFSWDVGYNFWAKSCEKICIDKKCTPRAFGCWALKGDNRVYGFVASEPCAYPYLYCEGIPVPLAATDSNATIHEGSNLRNGVDYTPIIPQDPTNLYADNNIRATATADNGIITHGIVTRYVNQAGSDGKSDQVYSSQPPILINECDFNLQGSRGLSNKVFTHINWAWNDREAGNWVPYLGFGAEVEFGNMSSVCSVPEAPCIDCENNPIAACNTDCCNACDTDCKSHCQSCALSQWGVWMKVGASYN